MNLSDIGARLVAAGVAALPLKAEGAGVAWSGPTAHGVVRTPADYDATLAAVTAEGIWKVAGSKAANVIVLWQGGNAQVDAAVEGVVAGLGL